jgi:hypothetical protein
MNIDKAFKQLKEELLLEGKNWENFYETIDNRLKTALHKKAEQYNTDEIKLLKTIRYFDPTATENNAGKYSKWIADLMAKKRTMTDWLTILERNPTTENFLYNYLKRFDQIQSNLEKKDINKYEDEDELINALEKYESKKSTKKLKGKADKTAEGWSIKKIENYEQSCSLGKGTKWCITEPEAFSNYIDRVHLFFVSDGKNKYAITVSKGDRQKPFIVYDEQDNKVGGLNFVKNKLPIELLDYMKKETNQ